MTKPTMREPYASLVRQELVALARQEDRARGSWPARGARIRIAVAVLVALALVVPATVFALTSAHRSLPAGERPTSSTASQALLLVPAIWRVRDAAGESAATWIRFDSEIDLIRPKGDVDLSWSTQGDALLTHVDGWSMTLGTRLPAVPWLTSTTRFARDGDGWVLTDAEGRTTARLVKDGVPPPSTQALHTVPKVDAFTRKRLRDAVAGATVTAIPPASAVGTWGLPGIATSDGSVTLTADGSWSARTSCEVLGTSDGGGGAYRLLPSGFLLATEGGIAGTGCTTPKKAPPADAKAVIDFGSVGSIAIDGARMTVYDRAGHRLGTLERKG